MSSLNTSLVNGLKPDRRAPNLLVGRDVIIDPSARIGANVVINDGVQVGPDVTIKHNCVIGERTSLAVDSKSLPQSFAPTVIAAGATICNGVVVFAGARIGPDVIIGDQAYVREDVDLSEDVVIGRGCNVGARSSVGARTKVQGSSFVLPGMVIEEDVFVGAMVCGATDHSMGQVEELARQIVTLRRGCRIGSCAVLLPGIEVGEEALVGAGAVVRESVAPRAKVAGVPARVIGVVDDV